eukprot:762935-Hanusia_phi.AAC.4
MDEDEGDEAKEVQIRRILPYFQGEGTCGGSSYMELRQFYDKGTGSDYSEFSGGPSGRRIPGTHWADPSPMMGGPAAPGRRAPHRVLDSARVTASDRLAARRAAARPAGGSGLRVRWDHSSQVRRPQRAWRVVCSAAALHHGHAVTAVSRRAAGHSDSETRIPGVTP